MKCIKVKVRYLAPYIKSLIGLDEETIIIVGEGASVRDVIFKIAEIHGEQLLTQLLNDNGGLRESLLALINNSVIQDINCKTKDGDTVTFLIAVNGG